MATFRLGAEPAFSGAATVTAYPRRLFGGLAPQPGEAPRTAAVSEATIDAHGNAELTGLEDDTAYYAGAQVGGEWRWKSFRTPTVLNSGTTIISGGGLTSADVNAILLAQGVVKARELALGNVSGNVTLDLALGEVFSMHPTADGTALQLPVNPPATAAAILLEVKITGKHTFTLPVTKWVGGEQPLDLSSESSENRYVLISDNGGVSYVGIGVEAPAEKTATYEGTPTNGQMFEWNAATSKLKPRAVPTGISEAEVKTLAEALIKELSILTGKHPMLLTAAFTGSGQFALTSSSSEAAPADFVSQVLATATARLDLHAALTANATLQVDQVYPVSTAAVKLTMPEGEQIHGRLVAIQNNSGGQIKLTGKFTPGSETVTTIELGAETVWYMASGSPSGWTPVLVTRTAAQLEALIKSLANIEPATTPAEAAEGAITAGTTGVGRRKVFGITGNGVITTWKLKHELATKAIDVTIQTTGAGKPKDLVLSLATLLGAEGSVKASTTNEIEVVFTVAPPAGTSYFVNVKG